MPARSRPAPTLDTVAAELHHSRTAERRARPLRVAPSAVPERWPEEMRGRDPAICVEDHDGARRRAERDRLP